MTNFTKMFAALIAFPVMAYATTDLDRTITKLGAQGNVAYIYVSPSPSTSCLYNVLYVPDTSVSSGKALYATLLTAQGAGKPLTRVDYTVQGNGTCYITLVEQ